MSVVLNIKDKYSVRSIDSFQTKEWLLKKHYLKRMPAISYAFGLFDKNILIGVLTIGKPASLTLCENICGVENKEYVYELNRLCVNDGLEKNVLSYFVSSSFNLIKDDLVIVSYADTEFGHHGYIYQATNWLYTGLTDIRKDKIIKGSKKHNRNASDYRGGEFDIRERSQKHRYVYFIGRKKRMLKKKLKYSSMPYPKGKNGRYDSSYKPQVQISLF